MPLSRPLLLTCAFALLVSGCDRQSAPPAQPQPTPTAAPAAAEQLTGKLDRSFAGTAMPAVTLKDPAGKTLESASLKGKPALVNLWATWCAPCVVEMPLLDTLAGELAGKLAVVTVSEDFSGGEVVTPFFARKGYRNLPQWLDPGNALAMAYGGGTALPLTVLYDRDGKEVWRVMGGYDWASGEARRDISEALKG
ncbi:MAG: TlpA disulfide reductase family protein [Croceibacterium sp.]